MSYIKYKRGLRKLPIYKGSSAEQREVLMEIVERVQYAERVIPFTGGDLKLQIGDLFISRPRLREVLNWSGVQDSHIRNMIKKLINNGYITSLCSSRNYGSVYRCLGRFFEEIAMPFDDRKLTNERPTIDQRLTNGRPTIDQRTLSNSNESEPVLTNNRPTIDQRLTENRPTIDHSRKNKEKRIKNNNTIPVENSDFGFLKVSLDSGLENQRKKVAAKKESEFVFPSVAFENPLDVYFGNQDNIKLFQSNYPLLDMTNEFSRMREWLGKKAADGNPQHGNFRGFVVKWLNNSEKNRQQVVSEQKSQLKIVKKPNHGNRKNTAVANGKFIPADKFAKYGSGGLLKL